MELQWQRQLECWLGLMGVHQTPVSESVAVREAEDVFYLEQVTGRARLSVARPLPASQQMPTLLRLLGLLLPETGQGLPLQAWVAHDCLWVAATAPEGSGAELWHTLGKLQRRLLDRAVGGADAHA